MNTQIPAARVPLIDSRSGLISREWYMFLFTLYGVSEIASVLLSHVKTVTTDTSPDSTIKHLLCSGNLRISLQYSKDRDKILTITNTGSGVITILPKAGETIKGESSLELDFQWTTVQLSPISGGYAII